MKTERHYSFRMLSFVMALLMLLSSMPTRTAAADWESGNIVITNPGNDNEYAVNAAGDDKNNTIALAQGVSTFDISKMVYYHFEAPQDGTVKMTISAVYNGTATTKWYAMYYPEGTSKSYTTLTDTQPEPAEVLKGTKVVLGIRIYDTSKWNAVAGTLTINVEFTSAGGGNDHTCGNGELQEGKAATCVASGYKDYYKCSSCDKFYEEAACTTEITDLTAWQAEGGNGYIAKDADNHTSTEVVYKNITEATHDVHHKCCDALVEANVQHTYEDADKCVCGAEKPACDHDYEGVETTAPTCTEKGVKTYTCSKCGNSYTEDITELGHEWGDWEEKTPASCTEQGENTRSCSRCTTVETEVISAKGHKDENGDYLCDVCGNSLCQTHTPATRQENIVPATSCQQGGSYTLVTYCVTCGSVIDSTPVTTDPLPHQFAEYTFTTEPGCTTLGAETASCTYGCGEEKTRYVMPLGHNFVDGVCTDCDATEASVGKEANPAPFVIGDNTGTAPNNGYCFFAFTAVIDGTVTISTEETDWYAYIYINGTDVTSEYANGLTRYNSRDGRSLPVKINAGNKLVVKISPYVGYAYGGEITVNFQFASNCTHGFAEDGTPATCTTPGRVGYTCAECNISYAVYSRALGHTWVNATCTTPKTCSECKVTEGNALGHTEETIPGKAATCKETGLTDGKKCTVCGVITDAQEEIPLADHTPGEPVAENGKEPNCTQPGTYEKVVYCTVCKAELSRETVTEAAKGHTWVNATCTTPKTCSVCNATEGNAVGHNAVTDEAVAPTCTETGLTEGSHCSVCGEVIVAQETVAALGHTEVTDEAVDPTCTETGLTEGSHCSVCNKVLVAQETVAATGHNYVDDECTKCGDTGIAIPEDGKLVSGQLYIYTAAKDMHLEIQFGNIYDSDGNKLFSMDDNKVVVRIGDVIKATLRKELYLTANQSVKLMLVAMNDKTYTATATLAEKTVNFLTLGENTIEAATEYIYVAQEDGTLYLEVKEGTVEVNGEAPATEYALEAGEKITVTNEGEANAQITLRFVTDAELAPGSEKNPLALPFANCPASTMEIPAGGTVWYQLSNFKNGYVLKVTGENAYIMVNDTRYNAENGVVTLKVTGNHLIQIGNAGTETAAFEMETYIPVGHADNPADLIIGENTANIPAGGDYYYVFTATEAGTIKITVTGEYWCFSLNQEPARYAYKGESNTVELELQAGDRIELKLSAVNDSWQNVGGTLTANVSFGSNGVAQIGNTKYETLQAAIDAAVDGDTIVLLSDLSLNSNDAKVFAPEAENEFKTMFVVEGKTITIDLNGKTIFVDATTGFGEGTILAFPENDVGMIDWKADRLQGMLMAVIAVHNNGHLTLTGNGCIETMAHDGNQENKKCGIVYSVLANYGTDSSITIKNGTYKADFTRDSLIYTHASANEGVGNTGVVVNGGTFYLGNAGQGRNYSTWIFNAKGQNERHVWVTGGTFSTDIHHQYWIFEVQGPKELALKMNDDSTYTIVNAVAYVAERHGQYTKNVGYTTLEEAIAACADDTYRENTYYSSERYDKYANEDKVVLLKDIELANDIDVTGKTVAIELNGFEITGGTVIGALIYNNGVPINQEENEGETSESET